MSVHSLSDVDVDQRTATCSVCGPVAVVQQGSYRNGRPRWRCRVKMRQAWQDTYDPRGKPQDWAAIIAKLRRVNRAVHQVLMGLEFGVVRGTASPVMPTPEELREARDYARNIADLADSVKRSLPKPRDLPRSRP
jgi:hypothetical protein